MVSFVLYLCFNILLFLDFPYYVAAPCCVGVPFPSPCLGYNKASDK